MMTLPRISLVLFCFLTVLCTTPGFSQYSVDVTYEAPGILNSTVANSLVYTFNTDPLGSNATVAWSGVGSFTNVQVKAPDQYGGADATRYSSVAVNRTMTLALNTPQSYFGMWWSAGDGYNALTFYQGTNVVASFTTAILTSMLSTNYNGMPRMATNAPNQNPGSNSREKYAFINFYGMNGTTFDTVLATQGKSAAFESDNWTISTNYGSNGITGTPVANYETGTNGKTTTNAVVVTPVILTNTDITADTITVLPPSTNFTGGGSISGTGTITGNVINEGTISGNETINGNVTNAGTLIPGSSNAPMIINGDLIDTTNSTTVIVVHDSNNYGQVDVNGTASNAGTLEIVGNLSFGDQLDIIKASNGITGDFNEIITPEGIRPRVETNGAEETIIIAPTSYTEVAVNQNQTNVAKALDTFIPATAGDKEVVSTALDKLTTPQYQQAFNAVMPTMYQSLATIAFNLANAQNMELVQRLWGQRVAGTGFSSAGLPPNSPVYQESEGKNPVSSKNPVASRRSAKDILAPGEDNHWGMFVDGNGIFAQANSANMLPGYNSQSGGVTAGLTYLWNRNFETGLYAGYEGTYAKYGANGSGLGVGSRLIDNAVRFGVFGTYGQKGVAGESIGFHGVALAGGAYNSYQVTRMIQFQGLNRTANSSPGAGELDTLLGGGYDWKKGNFVYGPTASLQYTYLGVNGVGETGAQSLNFNSSGWNTASMLSSVGAHAAYTWQASRNIVVLPQISLNWQHEFLQDPYAINGNLGGSPTFANWSATGIRDYLYTGVGFTVEFAKRWNSSLFYNASAGNADLVSQNVFWSAGVTF